MPFQVAVSYKKNELPPIILITAGNDQIVACGTEIILEATVDELLNLPGHTLEWEQLTGTAVTLSCPTCLMTSYPLSDLSEKTFRFWIDRGIPTKEQYDDITIFHTATSRQPIGGQMSGKVGGSGGGITPADSPECESIVATALPPPPEMQSAEVVGAGVGLIWDIPPRVDLQPFITQYTVYEDGTPVQTTAAADPRVYQPTQEAVYQIFTEFLVNGIYSSDWSCERDFINDLPLPNVLVIDDYTPVPAVVSAKPNVAITRWDNSINSEGDSVQPVGGTMAMKQVVSIVKFGNLINSEGDSAQPVGGTIADSMVVAITRYDSGSIGG